MVGAVGAAASPLLALKAEAVAPTVMVLGDSIVWGNNLPVPARDCWLGRVNERIGGATCTALTNRGLGGICLNYYPTLNNTTYMGKWGPQQVAAAPPDIAIVSCGVNDLMVTADMGPIVWGFYNLNTALFQAGAKQVLFTTILPYGHGWAQPDGWLPALNDRRDQVNNWMRAMWGPRGQLIERDAILEVQYTPYMDARYALPDGLHPNAWGALLLANSFPLAAIGY